MLSSSVADSLQFQLFCHYIENLHSLLRNSFLSVLYTSLLEKCLCNVCMHAVHSAWYVCLFVMLIMSI